MQSQRTSVSSVAKHSNPERIDLEMSHSSDDEISNSVEVRSSSFWNKFRYLFSKRSQTDDEDEKRLLTGKKIYLNEIKGIKQLQMQEESVSLEIDDSTNDLKIGDKKKRNRFMKFLCSCFETNFQKQYKRMN